MKVVKGAFTQAGQFRVIIGNTVSDFCNDFVAVAGVLPNCNLLFNYTAV